MKPKLLFIFLLFARVCLANMASPFMEGSKNASAFSSKDVIILHENINVRIGSDFKTAKFTIEYLIKSDVTGGQIPLLFLAKDYKDNFSIWVDDKLVAIQQIPNYLIVQQKSKFEKFEKSFEGTIENNPSINISWQKHSSIRYNLNDLKYFETDLQKGEHKIKVEYVASAWIDNSDWVKEYSFRYSLAPAKHWKSFGSLHISVDQYGEPKPLTTNLGNPAEGQINGKQNWEFTQIPGDIFTITYKPQINKLPAILISIDPFGIMIIVGVLLLCLNILLACKYRKKYPAKKFSWVVIAGSILVPYAMLHSYFISYNLIDYLIGIDASKRHGYYFVIIFLYPVILIIYLLIMWIIDLFIKRKLNTQNIQ